MQYTGLCRVYTVHIMTMCVTGIIRHRLGPKTGTWYARKNSEQHIKSNIQIWAYSKTFLDQSEWSTFVLFLGVSKMVPVTQSTHSYFDLTIEVTYHAQ